MEIAQDKTRERFTNEAPPFLIKLYKIVDDEETNSIISWGSTLTTLIIYDEPRFVSEILPCYFKTNRFDSFASQLKNYGFVRKDWSRLEFGHEHFQQGKQDLLKTIKRRNKQSNLVISKMSTPSLCHKLKSTFEKARHDQKQIKNRILRFEDDNQKTLLEMKNMIWAMSQRLLPLTSGQKRKFIDISDDDLLSCNEVLGIDDGVEDCFTKLSELVEKPEEEENFDCCGRKGYRRIPQFLHKLYDMVKKQEIDHLISWNRPNCDSFIIWDVIEFATHVLPVYFKHTNFGSFHSQLNIYGFKKVSWEREEYANEWFIGEKYELLANIKRRNKLIGFDKTYSSSQVQTFMTRLRKIQYHQENQMIWLSNYEEQIKTSMLELKETVVKMDNDFDKMILRSSENLENVKAPKLDIEQNAIVIDDDNEQESRDNHMTESKEDNNMEPQSCFQELEIDQEAVERIIEMKDEALIEMDRYWYLCHGN